MFNWKVVLRMGIQRLHFTEIQIPKQLEYWTIQRKMENDFLRPAKSDNLAPQNIWNSWFSLPTIQLFVWKREKERKVIPRPLWLKERQRVFNGKVFQVESFKVTSLVIFFQLLSRNSPAIWCCWVKGFAFTFVRPLRFLRKSSLIGLL